MIKSSSDEIKERLEQCIGSGNATNMRRLCEGMYEEVGRVTENSQIMNTLVNDVSAISPMHAFCGYHSVCVESDDGLG